MSTRRALHFVLKITDRANNIKFFREILGMKVLRHEEFDEGCKAACNGPYDGHWSKTMIGYGDESNHFVLELTYTYGIGKYENGNDLVGITIHNKQAIENVKTHKWESKEENGDVIVVSPDGYTFRLKQDESGSHDPIRVVSLASSDLQKSIKYWNGLLGMKVLKQEDKPKKCALLGYDEMQCKLEFVDIGQEVNHAKAYGRTAFSCPASELKGIESKVNEEKQKILTPYTSLDTPGKATVIVVILADPDGHEICFVGDEAYRELSKLDPNGDQLLMEAISKDKSDEWFKNKGKSKADA